MKHRKPISKNSIHLALLALIPVAIALWVWLSALAFVPSPWPDDSAFYFVAHELFRWPPRWVMLPQAPFEPTYRIFNFNTMPLYPILIGLGRWIGIDGSFLLKLWPLGAWALSGSLLVSVLYRKGLPWIACALIAFAYALDPESRWASVLVRPESLIGLFGMALVLGLTFEFPEKLRAKKLWDPVAALLALAAYSHFNAIHLVVPVIFAYAYQPRKLISIGAITSLYLVPWGIAVLSHFDLFVTQMGVQWHRLSVPNSWLSSPTSAISSLFQALGSPEPWPDLIHWASVGIWILIAAALVYGLLYPLVRNAIQKWKPNEKWIPAPPSVNLLPAAGWVFGAMWIYDSKPEVWFIYYLHVAVWCFAGLMALELWKSSNSFKLLGQITLGIVVLAVTAVSGYIDVTQAKRLGATQSWNWPTYYDFVKCIDDQLTHLESTLEKGKPFRIWGPTPPDVLIELSRKHPHWELTRTTDFMDRIPLAIQHGWDTEAVVVTETLNWDERKISAKAELVPSYVRSLWLNWDQYFLKTLYTNPGWKPNRYVCQRGRWQAFIFMVPEGKK
jgi:hypothetical protein